MLLVPAMRGDRTMAFVAGATTLAIVIHALLVLGDGTEHDCLLFARDRSYYGAEAFVLAGIVLGLGVASFIARDAPRARIAFAAAGLAWSASISIGYPTPVLATGALACVLGVSTLGALGGLAANAGAHARRFGWIFAVILALFAGWRSTTLRMKHIYRERSLAELRVPLDGILAGGRGLRTNPRTADYLRDLNDLVASLEGRDYALLPGVAAHWIRSRQKNPLLLDWEDPVELPTRRAQQRAANAVARLHGRAVVIVSKTNPDSLAFGAHAPTVIAPNGALAEVLAHWTRAKETRYFAIYE
jgi:hypothetical protein